MADVAESESVGIALCDETDVRMSVVIPVFNAERHVEAAVRSVLASDLKQIEVIVVDDGSTDRSLSIVSAIEDPRIVVLSLTPSGGPSRPRNTGITRARAPYVALLDADDLMKPDKLSTALAVLERHPQAGIAFADFERIDDDGALLAASTLADYPVFRALPAEGLEDGWHLLRQEHFSRGLLFENFIGTSGVILRKSVLARVGVFDEALTYSEDRDLWFRLAHCCDALYRDVIGHSYRITAGSLSLRPGANQARNRITALRREKDRWTSAAERRQIDRLIAENLAVIAYDHRLNGRRGSALVTWLRVLRTAPSGRYVRGALTALMMPRKILGARNH